MNTRFACIRKKNSCGVFLLLFFSITAFAQHIREREGIFISHLNIHQGWRTMGDASVGLMRFRRSLHGYVYNGRTYEPGIQFGFNPKHWIIGPQFTFSWIIEGVSILPDKILQASLIYYTDFHSKALFFSPRFGMGPWYNFDFFIGYNIPLGNNRMKDFVNNITITLSVPLFNHFNTMGFP